MYRSPSSLAVCKVYVPHFVDERGGLHLLEVSRHLPFTVERVFWIDHVPEGAVRGCHAHWSSHEVLFAVHGTFDVETDDGCAVSSFQLSDDGEGLLIPAGVWCELRHFSSDAVCLVLASEEYDATGYVHDKSKWRATLSACGNDGCRVDVAHVSKE